MAPKRRSKLSKTAPSQTGSPSPAMIPIQVREAILLTYGLPNPDPGTLDAGKQMSDFGFNDFQWMKLAGRLTGIVQEYQPDNSVSVAEAQNTGTVQDCIDLVAHKSKG